MNTGLDVLRDSDFSLLGGKNIGVLCHQASVDRNYQHIIDLLLPLHQQQKLNIQAVFGPQHGLWGHTQDNMIEWEGYQDQKTGLKIYSLYGENRKPTQKMLNDIDLFMVDLQDVGARYYTFIWTMALCMEACEGQHIDFMLLDRPNPIDGITVEGTVLDSEYKSFVGLFPLPQRHGMTIGEIANYLKKSYFKKLSLKIYEMQKWHRKYHFPETGLPWIMPSPNMPVWETSLVYPGQCLLEATNLSEGRGTTRPFEICGAPWIDGKKLSNRLNAKHLPGVHFRFTEFLPTFHKFHDQVCQGVFIHVTDHYAFKPVLSTIALLQEIKELYPQEFKWKEPPYEYEYQKLPIDILAGNSWLRQKIDDLIPLVDIEERMNNELNDFESARYESLLY